MTQLKFCKKCGCQPETHPVKTSAMNCETFIDETLATTDSWTDKILLSAGFDRVECLDEVRQIYAYRFHGAADPYVPGRNDVRRSYSGDYIENFFVENLSNFKKLNLNTKVIGNSILVFPKGGA